MTHIADFPNYIIEPDGKIFSKVRVEQVDFNGNVLKVFGSIKEATNSLGVKQSHISECCLNKRKTSNGYVWRYAKEE